jgi:DNA-directed RNA polymerase specialized sigma24 family protein
MKPALSEKEIINAIVNRDPAGAAALYDRYAATLFKVICCSACNKEIAEAILEKTINTVWHNFHDFHRQDKHLLLWMVGIARNEARQA